MKMRRLWQAKQVATVIEPDEPEPPSPYTALGIAQCDGVGCSSRSGIPCAYVDRRNRKCPTAWCPSHRSVFDDAIYCALHGATVGGLQSDYGDYSHPDVDNSIPALVSWVSRIAEDDVVATLRSICRDRDEVLVSDPVRRVFLGVERERCWERAWKVCSVVGVSARVAIAVEESNPAFLLAKVNSKVVARIPAPQRGVGSEPQHEEVETLFRGLVMPVALALDFWQQGKPIETDLTGRGPNIQPTESPPPPPAALPTTAQEGWIT
jgi:hypothetical protein